MRHWVKQNVRQRRRPEGSIIFFGDPDCSEYLVFRDYHGPHGLSDSLPPSPFYVMFYTKQSIPILITLEHGWQSVFDSLVIVDLPTGGLLFRVDMHAQNRDTVTLRYVNDSVATNMNGFGILYHGNFASLPSSCVLEVPKTHASVPSAYSLVQNYPNPFNPTTTIRYQLPTASFVHLALFNILGEEVRTLVSEREEAGYKSVSFDGSTFPSGVYFYRINAGTFTAVKRMVLVR
jgi:hypothetical protein